MSLPTSLLLNPADLRLGAQVRLTSNGDGAKTAKVTVVARSGDAIEHPYWGRIVHDFAGMTSKSKVPLDYAHDCDDSIGYLNKFDTSSGDLVCSGVIVLVNGAPDGDPDDDVFALVAKMEAGVPYEASIQFGEDCLLEFVPDGYSVNVNGRDIEGPLTVVRQWTLKAVAICKFGADSDTSAELQFSKRNVEEAMKGFFVRFAKTSKGALMESNIEQHVQADKAVAVEAPVETAQVVEADAKAEKDKAVKPVAETAQVVEAEKTEAVEQKPEPVVAEEAMAVAMTKPTEAVDPRNEFKQFVAKFGGERAATYFAEGMSFTDAVAKFADEVAKENADLKKRLSAVDRGAEKPVAFSRVDSADVKPQGMTAVVKLAGKTK